MSVTLHPAVYAEAVVVGEERGESLSRIAERALLEHLRKLGRPLPRELAA